MGELDRGVGAVWVIDGGAGRVEAGTAVGVAPGGVSLGGGVGT